MTKRSSRRPIRRRPRTAIEIARDLAALARTRELNEFHGVPRADLDAEYARLRDVVKDELNMHDDDDSLAGQEAAYLLGVEIGRGERPDVLGDLSRAVPADDRDEFLRRAAAIVQDLQRRAARTRGSR